MIKVEMIDLPVEKIKRIREWLDKEECGWLENCIGSQIAALQADATNAALSEPHRTIGDEHALPPESVSKIKEAAVLQTFLDVLAEMRDQETKFQTAKLTTTLTV